MIDRMNILTLSGSLRAGASNTALLDAAALVAPSGMGVRRYPSIAALPHFNPDDDVPDRLPAAAADFRVLVGQSDALLLSTPEYAHGLPGSFKNALDWLVGSTEFPGKPVAIVNPLGRSVHAPEQLREILVTMSARLVERASIVIELPSRNMDAAAIAADARLAALLRSVLEAITNAVQSGRDVNAHVLG
jgi:chromate reductase, NAD(P)H dehydrogenase (quinone)